MISRRAALLITLPALLAAALAGCGKKPESPAAAETARPALIEVVGRDESAIKQRFPGRLRAVKRAELSFAVPGVVAEFSLVEGSRVQAGQVLARLDDAVFKSRLNAVRAEFERASTDLDRYQRLWDSEQAVARAEVDERRSRLEVARTNLASAQQDLADTLMRAPFAGVITRRRLEGFANVQAKQAIADLQDPSSLEVVIHVPQRMLRDQGPRAEALAVFDEREDLPLPLRLKSYASESDPVTQTYEVVLALQARPPAASGLTLLPGMSVTVLPAAPKPGRQPDAALTIPLTAVASDAAGKRLVWVVGDDGRASPAAVELGEIRADRVIVVAGLQAGQRIVSAGVGALRPGMKLRPLDAR